MYERMLNKQVTPTITEMTEYCGSNAELFTQLNGWLSETYGTCQTVKFPYGNQYGWGIAHRKKQKLICNVFAEDNAFTVRNPKSSDSFHTDRRTFWRYESALKYTQKRKIRISHRISGIKNIDFYERFVF